MALKLNPNIWATFAPPVMEARRWIEGVTFPGDRPLLNLSQAAPVEAPPEALRREIAEIALSDPTAHIYGPVLGLPGLREELARQVSRLYGGSVNAENVAITAGCNEAFTAVITALAAPGDEVILPTPWYFNHKMALDMGGQVAVPLPTGEDLLPEPERAATLISERTRAIVLVTPNNPGGVEYPPELMARFAALARSQNIALIVDETYRDFHSREGAPHDLFTDPDWADVLIHLYSFSKAYRLTGHRVGAMIAGTDVLAQVEKYLDTVTICPNQIGQRAALWGMRNLGDWLAGERQEILSRRAAVEAGFETLDGWDCVSAGAYFAWVRHPFGIASDELAMRLVTEAGLLLLPGTMFRPADDPLAAKELRIAFANADRAGLSVLFDRLSGLRL